MPKIRMGHFEISSDSPKKDHIMLLGIKLRSIGMTCLKVLTNDYGGKLETFFKIYKKSIFRNQITEASWLSSEWSLTFCPFAITNHQAGRIRILLSMGIWECSE